MGEWENKVFLSKVRELASCLTPRIDGGFPKEPCSIICQLDRYSMVLLTQESYHKEIYKWLRIWLKKVPS